MRPRERRKGGREEKRSEFRIDEQGEGYFSPKCVELKSMKSKGEGRNQKNRVQAYRKGPLSKKKLNV